MKPIRTIVRTALVTNAHGSRLLVAELSCGHVTQRSDKHKKGKFTCTRLACGKCERGQP